MRIDWFHAAATRPGHPTGIDQHVMLMLGVFAKYESGIAWPSLEAIMQETGLGERTVRRSLRSLEKDGHISVVRGGRGQGQRSKYHLGGQTGPLKDGLGGHTGQVKGATQAGLGGHTGQTHTLKGGNVERSEEGGNVRSKTAPLSASHSHPNGKSKSPGAVFYELIDSPATDAWRDLATEAIDRQIRKGATPEQAMAFLVMMAQRSKKKRVPINQFWFLEEKYLKMLTPTERIHGVQLPVTPSPTR